MFNSGFMEKTKIKLCNSLLILLTESDFDKKYSLLSKFFNLINQELMVGVICKDKNFSVPNDKIIKFVCNISTNKIDVDFQTLDAELRKIKKHRYINNNDLTVCLYLDSNNDSFDANFIIDEISAIFSNAYSNKVIIDIYFFVKEEFINSAQIISKTTAIKTSLNTLQELECVRYIFLLSDVSSDGVLVNDFYMLFNAALLSTLVTNYCDESNEIKLLQDTLMRETESGKYFCIGHFPLEQNEEIINSTVKASLIKRICKYKGKLMYNQEDMARLCNCSYFTNDVYDFMSRKSVNIRSVKLYEKPTYKKGDKITNYQLLTDAFGVNYRLFLSDLYKEAVAYSSEREKVFWENIKSLLDEMIFCNFGTSDLKYSAETVFKSVDNALDNSLYENWAAKKVLLEEEMNWRQEVVHLSFLPFRINAAYRVLSEWIDFKCRALSYYITENFIIYLKDMLDSWMKDYAAKHSILNITKVAEEKKVSDIYEYLPNIMKLLYIFQTNSFDRFLDRNQWYLDRYNRKISSAIFSGSDNIEIAGIIEKYTAKTLLYGQRHSYSWANLHIPMLSEDPHSVNKLYSEIYNTLRNESSLLSRRQIHNGETYLCFCGKTSSDFADYVRECGEDQYILDNMELHENSAVVLFHHLDSYDDFFC